MRIFGGTEFGGQRGDGPMANQIAAAESSRTEIAQATRQWRLAIVAARWRIRYAACNHSLDHTSRKSWPVRLASSTARTAASVA